MPTTCSHVSTAGTVSESGSGMLAKEAALPTRLLPGSSSQTSKSGVGGLAFPPTSPSLSPPWREEGWGPRPPRGQYVTFQLPPGCLIWGPLHGLPTAGPTRRSGPRQDMCLWNLCTGGFPGQQAGPKSRWALSEADSGIMIGGQFSDLGSVPREQKGLGE